MEQHMATAEEGTGVIANANPSSYSAGGVGGKFRRKMFRRQATPYDRPPNIVGKHEHRPAGWLNKIFVEPAVKFISYGADRFFASVFRKRLPAPAPPPPQPEMNHCTTDGAQLEVLNEDKGVPEEPVSGQHSIPNNASGSKVISELEQLLKQCTFTRTEIVHITELLQLKAAEVFPGDVLKEREVAALAPVMTPVLKSKVSLNDYSSPAEIAKAYMGAKAPRGSPSVLGVHNQDARSSANVPFDFKSSNMLLTENMSVVENGVGSLSSQAKSAIYNMTHTPFTRGHSRLKMASSSSFDTAGNDKKYAPGSLNTKRGISYLDDDFGSVGPVRRTRQKSNLMATQISHDRFVDGIGSHSKKKQELMEKTNNKLPKGADEYKNPDAPCTSYVRAPSRSSEVAAKILQQLEKLSPKEKSSESKSLVRLEKSKKNLTSSVLSGQVRGTTMGVNSPIQPFDMQCDKNHMDMSIKPPDSHISLQKPENKKANGSKDNLFSSATEISFMKQDLSMGSRSFMSKARTMDSSVVNGTFQMSAQGMDDNVPGPSSRAFQEKPEMLGSSATLSKVIPFEEPRIMKTIFQPTLVPPFSLDASKSNDLSSSSVPHIGDKKSFTFPSLGGLPGAESHSEELPLSFLKSKEANHPAQFFSFSTNVDDAFPVSNFESSSSLMNIFPVTGTQVKNPDVEAVVNLTPAKAYANGKSGPILHAANETLASVSLPSSFNAASSGGLSQKSTESGFTFASSTSASDIVKSSMASPFGSSVTLDRSYFGSSSNAHAFVGSSVFGSSASVSSSGTVAASLNSTFFVKKADESAVNGTEIMFSSGAAGNAVTSCPTSLSNSASGLGICGDSQILSYNSSTSLHGTSSGKNLPSFNPSAGFSGSAAMTAATASSSMLFGGFNWSTSTSSSATSSVIPGTVSSNVFGSSFQSPSSPSFGSTFTSFAASTPIFSFTTTPATVSVSSSLPIVKPIASGFTSFAGNENEMNTEYNMADDPVQSGIPAFGQASTSFGSSISPQPNPFVSFGQQNQVPLQDSGNMGFNAGNGNFTLGSGGPEKSRKTVRVSKIRNRK